MTIGLGPAGASAAQRAVCGSKEKDCTFYVDRETKVIECYEDYTSKTCGKCGALNQALGGKEVFNCPKQGWGYIAGRDTSAARNIGTSFYDI